MNNIKSDYRKGLIFFFILMICIFSCFMTPDGDTLFYKFIGLFGLSPGIPLGSATLYIYMLVPLIAAIVSIKKVLKYWKNYGSKFKEYNIFLRYLPVFIAIPIMLFSNIITPSLLDRAYFAVISQRNGLQSVTHYSTNKNLKYEFSGNIRTYSYEFALGNHSSETVKFNVKLAFENVDGLQEIFITEDSGELKTFSLPPKQLSFFAGEFIEHRQTMYQSGGGTAVFSIVLVHDDEQYSPKQLKQQPVF